MKRWFIPIFAAFALTFGITSVVRTQPRRGVTIPPVHPPSSRFVHTVAAVGLVEASTENIAVGSHLPGVVEKVYVTVGDSVRVGTPLFKIDDRNLRAQLEQADAGELAAEARVSVAAATLTRVSAACSAAPAWSSCARKLRSSILNRGEPTRTESPTVT